MEGELASCPWSEWATPIVLVPKTDGTVRICGDLRLTENPALKIDKYHLSRVEDILAALGKGILNSKD